MSKRKHKDKDRWIQGAERSMEKRGTVGKFGRATEKKIAEGKREGGVKKKEAVFAQNMKRIAKRRHHRGHSRR